MHELYLVFYLRVQDDGPDRLFHRMLVSIHELDFLAPSGVVFDVIVENAGDRAIHAVELLVVERAIGTPLNINTQEL